MHKRSSIFRLALLGVALSSCGPEGEGPVGESAAAAVPMSSWSRIIIDGSPGRRTLEKAFADIDGDRARRRDVVIGTGAGVRWYQFPASGDPRDTWVRRDILTTGDAYEGMQITDLSGDGRPDIVLSIDRRVEWLQHPGGTGTGAWVVHPIANGIGHELRLADLDGDGRTDVITSRTRNLNFQNNPTSWTTRSWGTGAQGAGQDGLAMLDVGGGRGAINVVGANAGGLYWFENPRERGGNARTGAWTAHLIGANDTGGPSIASMDVNGDGRDDVIVAPNEGSQGSRGLSWWEAPVDRTRAWTRHTIDASWQFVHWIEVGDFNGDGIDDLLVTEEEQAHDTAPNYRFNNDRIGLYYNDGAGTFTAQILGRTGGQNQVGADVDRDGDLDFVSANHGVYGAPNPIELFLNTGAGSPPPRSGLAAAYSFNEGAGTVINDASGQQNTGSLRNGTGFQGAGNSALVFDGANDYAEVPNSPSLDITGNRVTLETWVNFTDTGANQIFLAKPVSASTHASPYFSYSLHGVRTGADSLRPRFWLTLNGTGRVAASSVTIAPGWHFVAGTYDGATMRIYVDGVLRGSLAVAGSLGSFNTPLRLGTTGALTEPFRGRLDNVRIYARALSAAELESDRNAPVTP